MGQGGGFRFKVQTALLQCLIPTAPALDCTARESHAFSAQPHPYVLGSNRVFEERRVKALTRSGKSAGLRPSS